MVRAWYLGHNNESQREAPNDQAFLSLEELRDKTGVECLKFDADRLETDPDFAELKRKRGYSYEDVMDISREALPDYDEKLKAFYAEHLHADEEIRFVLGGGGYFDLRDRNDKWIRLEVTKDDLLILPAGLYHRFTLDKNNYIKLKRLFVEEVVWRAINRPVADELSAHKDYLKPVASAGS